MLGSAAVDNLVFQRTEEGVLNKLGTETNLRYSSEYGTKDVRKDMPDQILGKEDCGCVSKTISFPQDSTAAKEIKLYRKRFWILTLFSLCSMLNAMQWVQYPVVSDLIMCFYGVDIYAVGWTTNIYPVLYPILVLPISWYTERAGIRKSLLAGSFLTCIGTAIQCAATTPGSFALVMVSQTFSSVAQNFILPLPPYIAATWFDADELSRASAVGVFGNHLGCALGFIFGPLVMPSDCTVKDLIARGRKIVAYTLFSSNLLVFVLILATFNEKPELPPSLAQANKSDKESDFKRSLCALFKNINFDLLLIAHAIIVGISFAVSIILFSLVSPHFPRDTDIGWMGLLAILAGSVGSVVAGYVLDRTHRFKEISITVFVLSLVSMVIFAGVLFVHLLWVQFITVSIFGFFIISYLPVGLEFAVEITYPEPEAVSATILMAASSAVALVFSQTGSLLAEKYNDLVANGFFCAGLLVGIIIVALMKCDYRRQEQRNRSTLTSDS